MRPKRVLLLSAGVLLALGAAAQAQHLQPAAPRPVLPAPQAYPYPYPGSTWPYPGGYPATFPNGVRPFPQFPQPGLVLPQPGLGHPAYAPVFPAHHLSRRDIERRVEFAIKRTFGPCIDDVDVDVDTRKHKIEVDVEVEDDHFHPGLHHQIYSLLLGMPELAGFRIHLEVDD
ncbi:MAG TPA: hypothetical protein VIL46_04460 [Gemmataceae bacterium]